METSCISVQCVPLVWLYPCLAEAACTSLPSKTLQVVEGNRAFTVSAWAQEEGIKMELSRDLEYDAVCEALFQQLKGVPSSPLFLLPGYEGFRSPRSKTATMARFVHAVTWQLQSCCPLWNLGHA